MKLASFFAGEGGFDLAAEWMGWEPVLHCEINPFCRRILNYYWPNAFSYGNIKETDFIIHRGTIDILTGGFPCQPYSVAGKRLGKEDDRHLWPEMLRGIREIQPPWVVGENVRGLINWNGGLVFDEVQADLEAIGYEVTPFILPACAVNAPHRRDRVWFIAFNAEFSTNGRNNAGESSGNGMDMGGYKLETTRRQQSSDNIEPPNKYGIAPDPNNNGSHGTQNRQSDTERDDNNQTRQNTVIESSGCSCPSTRETAANTERIGQSGQGKYERPFDSAKDKNGKANWPDSFNEISDFRNFPTQPPVCIGNDGLPSELDGITVSDWIKESIKAHGNAIVPQVAYQIFKVIEQMNKLNK